MIEMIDRVAKAMDPEAFSHDFPVMAALHYQVRRNVALKRARAAIEAMREPTDVMVWTGASYLDAAKDEGTLRLVTSAYTAMIDASLKR